MRQEQTAARTRRSKMEWGFGQYSAAKRTRVVLVTTWWLLPVFCGGMHAYASEKRLFGSREEIAAMLGDVSEPVEQARAALPAHEVRRFKKDGWIVTVYFDREYTDRVIISKQDRAVLTDPEIAGLLKLMGTSWGKKDLPDHRAWYTEKKSAASYALVTKDGKTLEVLSNRYLSNLGEHVWLKSAEAEGP